jgi:hypothetical protein
MGSGLLIWSKTPVSAKVTFLRIIEAAYDSQIPFSLPSYDKRGNNWHPSHLTLRREENIIYHLADEESAIAALGSYVEENFYDFQGKKITNSMCSLAGTENVNDKMAFDFSYHYLKQNQEDYIGVDDLIIDWETMKTLYSKGYIEAWCWI